MKFSGRMCPKIILKVTKSQGFTLSSEDTFSEKPQGGRVTLTPPLPPSRFRVKRYFNEFFTNAVPNLSIPEFTSNLDQSGIVLSARPTINVIAKYENHPSVSKIRNKQTSFVNFSFSLVKKN